jgi:Arc/MetJ-type ribon-helix-helix transcriptional regulator
MSIDLKPELEQRIAAKVESGQYKSADEVVEKGLDLLEARTAAQPSPPEVDLPVWETISRLGQQVPDDELADVPTDFARNLKHYLYGAPKESGPE